MHMKMFGGLLLALILTGGCSTAPQRLHGADSVSRDIDALLAQVLRDTPDIPSIGIAVVRDGKPYYANAVGLADREQNTAANASTGYYIASSTKSYTGLACAVLASSTSTRRSPGIYPRSQAEQGS